jgi:squalene-hopene/tetraprenyl-beta-curcumene cyclase
MNSVTPERLESAFQKALAALLAERSPEGYWIGELSASALSTATAVSALALVQKQLAPHHQHDSLIARGLAWLAAHQNTDGGWGDTIKSFSNVSTTMLCRAAFHITERAETHAAVLRRADDWLAQCYGKSPEEQAEAVRARYGKDRTFAVPILTTCALAGLVSWREVQSLPFELACLPQAWFRFVRWHVVSYALPALIAIGHAVYRHRPPWNPLTRLVRALSRKRSLRRLEEIQPSSGGFLEATPLTSFVTISLAACGLGDHAVARNAVAFLTRSARADGSWPIDTNLATWLTTMAINALAAAGQIPNLDKRQELQTWLLQQQYRTRHPYTGAAPGGWAWTPLPGGVPDADDTPGALLALHNLNVGCVRSRPSDDVDKGNEHSGPRPDAPYQAGLTWLLDLQNRDGGWPTFCRGWGHLPFDRSGCDLTAHVLRALHVWQRSAVVSTLRMSRVIVAGLNYLKRQQRFDGSWLPLWFGNQHAPDDENPTYGTCRVLAAYRDLGMMNDESARRGIAWLVGAQNAHGGWGGAADTPSTVEETALAAEILADAGIAAEPALNRGLAWLVEQVETGGLANASPIGFYFAKLWYFEKLYPLILTVAALGRARIQYGNELLHRASP